MIASLIKFLLTDNESLASYAVGQFVTFKDVRRRMFLKAREQNRTLPDHYYRLAEQHTFRDIGSMADILIKGLPNIAEECLQLADSRVIIKPEKQNDWQELTTYISPLVLQCALLYKEERLDIALTDFRPYFTKTILPNTKYTAIPSARIVQLDQYVERQGGLHDLHMHLNGTLEVDQVWQDYLHAPEKIRADLVEGFKKDKVREQFEQESSLLDPDKFWRLLKTAQRMRSYFYNALFQPIANVGMKNYHQLLHSLSNDRDTVADYKHPFLHLVTNDDAYPYLMSVEALMYVLLLEKIRQEKNNELLAGVFHFYLLILGLSNRLLVQQVHQNGFEQFQKHTLNGLRWESEKTYLRRYFQLNGNDDRFIRFLEGRFAPSPSQEQMVLLLNKIWQGWNKLLQVLEEGNKPLPELKLIAHFIKSAEQHKDPQFRYKALRYDIWKRGKVLALLLKNHPEYREKIVAVDAASSEFDTPPEVFGPVFRLMRRAGIKHFTFHAGEDFYHIISGLRAVYEAIVFCDLRNGDRIGHATATALCPWQWQKVVGNEILIKQGEYLDNLVFTYHLIITSKITSLHAQLPFILNHIQNISYEIYNEHYPVSVLEKAWLMRQCCPVHAFGKARTDIATLAVFDEDEWSFMIAKGFLEDRKTIETSKVWQLYNRYHDSDYCKGYDKIIPIDPFELLKPADVETLQLEMLKEMNKREIVIETLPTSNVRIGFHKNFSTYHLRNWLRHRDEGKSIPPIIVGSDDTGIFATNIYNEYANIYCTLLHDHHMPHGKVMDVIKKLDEDSHSYRFK